MVSNYPNEIVTLELLGPYPASQPERYRFLLVITDHFTKWSEFIPLRKASARAIANALFENYISRYGAHISLINDNGHQFISEVFEHLSHRKGVESHPGKSRSSRKTSSDESKGRRSNKGTAGLEDPRLKRKVKSNGSVERTDKKRSKICRKGSLQGSEHGEKKRPTPVPTQGIKREQSHPLYNLENTNIGDSSQGPQSIAGPSHQLDTRQYKPPTEGSRQGARVQYDRARESSTTPSKGNRADERRPVWSRQATAVRPCPYYLRSRLKKSEGIPEE
ncbi:uncharacterized protein TNCV_2056591 [Trichonephila clavipes]|nr:uncharacterized protein TNCV_2056591 [Trichonephila clavipes]